MKHHNNNYNNHNNTNNSTYDWIGMQLWQERHRLVLGSVAMVLSSYANQSLPRLLGSIIDSTSSGSGTSSRSKTGDGTASLLLSSAFASSSSSSNNSTAWMWLIVVGGGLVSAARTVLLDQAHAQIVARLRLDLVRRLLHTTDVQFLQQSYWMQHQQKRGRQQDDGGEQGQDDKKVEKNQDEKDDKTTTTAVSNDVPILQKETNPQQEDEKNQSTSTTASATKDTDKHHTDSIDSDNSETHQHDPHHPSSSSSSLSSSSSPAAIAQILDRDVDRMASLCSRTAVRLLRSASAVTYSLVQMLYLDAALLGAAVAVIPLVGAVAMRLRQRIKKLQQQQDAQRTHLSAHVQERLSHLELVHASGRQDDEVQHYAQLQDESTTLAHQMALYQASLMGFLFAATSSVLVGVVYRGTRSTRLSSGQLSSFATYSFLLGLGTSGLVSAVGEVTQGRLAAQRYHALYQSLSSLSSSNHDKNKDDKEKLVDKDDENNKKKTLVDNKDNDEDIDDDPPQSTNDALKITLTPSQVTHISIQHLSFAYQSNPETSVLQDISLELPRGQVVALVGHNGSGKTTLASVLAGLYQPWQAGQVKFHCTDQSTIEWSQVEPKSRSQLVHLMSQTTALLDTSLLENVRYSHPSATPSDVRRALFAAQALDLMDQLDQPVGRNGAQLSGGQRQRVALARALLADPALLILDEPSTALDGPAQASVVPQIIQTCRRDDRAVLLIAHQYQAVQDYADEIVVLKQGRIVQRGTLSELTLLSTSNVDNELYRLMPQLFQGQQQQQSEAYPDANYIVQQ